MLGNYEVNRRTYPERLTRKGTAACPKRGPVRVGPEIKITMVRMTNPLSLCRGQKSPQISRFMRQLLVQGVADYVVSTTPVLSKQTAIINSFGDGKPKAIVRRVQVKYGIPRSAKAQGVRRFHSTGLIKCNSQTRGKHTEKGTSLKSKRKSLLPGYDGSLELDEFFRNLENGKKCNNLSVIMSDPDFLIGCWHKIKSKKGGTTPALTPETLDGIDRDWFEKVSTEFTNGKFSFSTAKRIYIPKPRKKNKRPLTIPNPRDKIVQEAMRFLLELIFEPIFRDSSHGFRPKRGCHSALNRIRLTFGGTMWFIEGDITQMYSTLNHTILTNLIKKKVDDQAFIDLLYKYMRTEYREERGKDMPMKIGVSQGGVLSPLLSNIYMHPFDEWMEGYLVPKFTRGNRRKANPEYTKSVRSGSSRDAIVKGIRPGLGNDSSYRRLKYIRYADDFLIGVIGGKEDCIKIREEIRRKLSEDLVLELNLEKTKITHSRKDSAYFLGYKIHLTKESKVPVRIDSRRKLRRLTPRPILDAPILKKVQDLKDNKFAKGIGNPTRNGRFIHLSIADIINHYRSIERGILGYYSMANNYGRLAARMHYILKYSCVLTIASKMRLRTMKRVFNKYGSNLEVKDEEGKIITSYPTCDYKRPRKFRPTTVAKPDQMITDLSKRIGRGRRDLIGPCRMCGPEDNIEIHHVKSLSKRKLKRKPDWLLDTMIRMNRKQIPLCKPCHTKYHKEAIVNSKR